MLEFFSIILKVIFIVFFFGFCVGIHEFGHMLVALWQGLHVEKFSIGMGPKLWGFQYKGVAYQVGWLPFGGFVSLPQLDPVDDPKTSDDKPLPHASPLARALTAFAGPAFNILFGFVLATVMWGVGLWEPAPSDSALISAVPVYLPEYVEPLQEGDRILRVNGEAVPGHDAPAGILWGNLCYEWNGLFPETIPPEWLTLQVQGEKDAAPREITFAPKPNPEFVAGLREGDRVIAVNGKTFTGGVNEFQQEYVYSDSAELTLTIVRDGQTREISYAPLPNAGMEGLGWPFFEALNPLQVNTIVANSPAAAAGLEPGDQLLSMNRRNILGTQELAKMLPQFAGQTVPVEVSRKGRSMTLELSVPAVENLTPGEIGIGFRVLATGIMAGYPAADAGLRVGDQFLAVEQLDRTGNATERTIPILDMTSFQQAVRNSQGNPLRITYMRNDQERQITIVPRLSDEVEPPTYLVGVELSNALSKVIMHVDPWTQFTRIMSNTGRTLGLLFAPLTAKLSGVVSSRPRSTPKAQIGVKHMSGPLGILQMLWFKLRDEGYRGGFAFIILITFSLAVMNLLPLPVLDGGHILFALIEALIRRRLPAKFLNYIYNVFAVLLISLMLYITFFDSLRLARYARFSRKLDQLQEPAEKNGHKTPPVERVKETELPK